MKFWLRDNEQVEVIIDDDDDQYWREFGREQRSIMAELLTSEEAKHLEVSEGRWLFPGKMP
jgi:hypothetical protein